MKRYIVGAMAGLLAAAGVAQADFVVNLNHEFSGAFNPVGNGSSNPWMKATFSNHAPNQVLLRIDTFLSSTEFVAGFYFNVRQQTTVGSVTVGTNTPASHFAMTHHAGFTQFEKIAIKAFNPLANAAFKADGDGYFDFRVDFFNSAANRFGGTNSITFLLDGVGAEDFWFDDRSEVGGGNLTWHAAAHVQGINGANSGWIGGNITVVPLPNIAGLGLLGLGMVGLRRVRR